MTKNELMDSRVCRAAPVSAKIPLQWKIKKKKMIFTSKLAFLLTIKGMVHMNTMLAPIDVFVYWESHFLI